MNLVIQTGEVTGAVNSYCALSEIRQFAKDHGESLALHDDELTPLVIRAFEYLEKKDPEFQGCRINLCSAFPRHGVMIYGRYFDDSGIPDALKWAQSQAVIVQSNGSQLLQDREATEFVVEDQIGPIRTKYANPLDVGIDNKFDTIDAFLQPLTKRYGKFNSGVKPLVGVRQ